MLKKLNNAVTRAAISLMSLGIVFYAVRGELADAWSYIIGLNIGPFLFALVIFFGSLYVVTLRLRLILSIQGVVLPKTRLYYLWVISLFFNLFLPSAVGGDIAKAYYIYKDCHQKMVAASSVIMDRLFGLMATLTMGSAAFLCVRGQIRNPEIGMILFWFVVILAFGLLCIISRRFSEPATKAMLKLSRGKVKSRLENFLSILEKYRHGRKNFILAYGYSVIAQGLFIGILYLLARSIYIQVPLSVFFLLIPLVTISSLLPSIGGLGVREATMVYLFKSYVPMEQAVAFSMISAFFLYGIGAACGILYAFCGGASVRELQQIEEDAERGS